MFVLCVVLALLHLSFEESAHDHQKTFHEFKGCRFDRFEGRSCLNRYYISDMINNKPRQSDYLKLRMYFTDRRPIICIHNEEKQITFGEFSRLREAFQVLDFVSGFYRNSSTFGIFKSHREWEVGEQPCSYQRNVNLFSENRYTEVEMTLAKG